MMITFTLMTTGRGNKGLYYYGARYYDPKVSVWLSVDPMAAERSWLTPYNFVSNNPLLRVDPDGNLDICETCPNEPRFDEYRDSPVNYEFTPNGNGGGEVHVSNHQTLDEVNVSPTVGPQMVASNGNYNGFNLVTARPGYLIGQGKETRKGEGKTINIDNFMLSPTGGNSLSNWLNVLPKAFDFVDIIYKILEFQFSGLKEQKESLGSSFERSQPDSVIFHLDYKNFHNPYWRLSYEYRDSAKWRKFFEKEKYIDIQDVEVK